MKKEERKSIEDLVNEINSINQELGEPTLVQIGGEEGGVQMPSISEMLEHRKLYAKMAKKHEELLQNDNHYIAIMNKARGLGEQVMIAAKEAEKYLIARIKEDTP